jgi:hypothetical protein
MIVQLLVSGVIAGTLARLALFILPLPLAVAAGVCVGVVAAQVIEGRRTGRTRGWPGVVAQGLVAGTTAWLMITWIHR